MESLCFVFVAAIEPSSLGKRSIAASVEGLIVAGVVLVPVVVLVMDQFVLAVIVLGVELVPQDHSIVVIELVEASFFLRSAVQEAAFQIVKLKSVVAAVAVVVDAAAAVAVVVVVVLMVVELVPLIVVVPFVGDPFG